MLFSKNFKWDGTPYLDENDPRARDYKVAKDRFLETEK
jgi:hypothetical protein